MMLPDVLTLPPLLAGLGFTQLLEPWEILDHTLGAVAGYVALRVIASVYRAWRGRVGLGGGDARLLAAAGAWVGWQALPWVVFEASFAGIAAALIVRLFGHRISQTTAVPFGPFIVIAVWLVWLYGTPWTEQGDVMRADQSLSRHARHKPAINRRTVPREFATGRRRIPSRDRARTVIKRWMLRRWQSGPGLSDP